MVSSSRKSLQCFIYYVARGTCVSSVRPIFPCYSSTCHIFTRRNNVASTLFKHIAFRDAFIYVTCCEINITNNL